MARAKLGFCGAASVDGFIFLRRGLRAAFGFGQFLLVKDRIADNVLFAGPRTQVEQAAALAAEREVPVGFGVGGALANRAAMVHGASLSQNAQRRSGGDAVEGFASRLRVRSGMLGRTGQNFDNLAD